ncbi:ROK family protein [Maritalea porphyrae]|jgi:N-acylmannosamine kinase|uniref:ROK family protein n=1 Tax=Maritalea porphyrae TaxID=880732 RepID=UPI0022AF860C|nr:ROK family protein [Maritalea porphyrae]MCZ4273423.1 ROK family protein [Maritalea porphyrae]
MTAVTDMDGINGFAVDLGGTKLAAARVEHGRVVERIQNVTEAEAPADKQVEAIEALLRKIGWNHSYPVSVAVAGRVSDDGTWSAVNTGTLTSIADIPIKALLTHQLNTDVYVCNDANAAAFAEASFGSGVGVSHFAYITVSTGVGGGIVIEGKPLTSANGLAGHVGFVSSRFSTAICGSGRRSTVESVAGGRAISAIAQEQGHGVATAREVFDAAAGGNEWAQTIIETSAQAIAALCSDLTAIFGLDMVALGGSIGMAPGYIASVERHLKCEPALFRPKIAAADFSHDSALIGVIALSQSSKRTEKRHTIRCNGVSE